MKLIRHKERHNYKTFHNRTCWHSIATRLPFELAYALVRYILPRVCSDCILLCLRSFKNMGDKTHPFTAGHYDTLYAKSYIRNTNIKK